jgi:hypothetical protein
MVRGSLSLRGQILRDNTMVVKSANEFPWSIGQFEFFTCFIGASKQIVAHTMRPLKRFSDSFKPVQSIKESAARGPLAVFAHALRVLSPNPNAPSCVAAEKEFADTCGQPLAPY